MTTVFTHLAMTVRNVIKVGLKFDKINTKPQKKYRQKQSRIKLLIQNAERYYSKKGLTNCIGNLVIDEETKTDHAQQNKTKIS